MPTYFGVNIKDKHDGLKLTRENYAIINRNSSVLKGHIYSENWCNHHLELCLKNFDLNMEYFSLLNHDDFQHEIVRFLKIHPRFRKVDDLQHYENISGYYMMVLEEYRQVYIGNSRNIKSRIMSHWSSKKEFDRLIFPGGAVNTSKLSIDSFRAFDTTEIYICPSLLLYTAENLFINTIPNCYITNRLSGGKIQEGRLKSLNMIKQRALVEQKELYDDNASLDAFASQSEAEQEAAQIKEYIKSCIQKDLDKKKAAKEVWGIKFVKKIMQKLRSFLDV